MPMIRFVLKENGTGSVISTTKLGLDDTTEVPCEFRAVPDQVLNKVEVRCHYFPGTTVTDGATFNTARALVVARMEALKVALRWKPPVVKPMARGVAVMPNVFNNFGDLVQAATNGSATTTNILTNCTLVDAAVVDDDAAINGITLSLTFGKVSASMV